MNNERKKERNLNVTNKEINRTNKSESKQTNKQLDRNMIYIDKKGGTKVKN